jgi:Protein of unknown function (DUF3800)
LGILYLDEAGNTGLKDPNQPFLLYGGPFVCADKWKDVNDDFEQVQKKCFSLIFSRIDKVTDPARFGETVAQVEFLKKFHFHAAQIMNRNGLWSKLDDTKNEHFQLIEDILTVAIKHKIKFFIGIIKKSSVTGNPKNKPEFAALLPAFFQHVDSKIDNHHFMVIWDDGDSKERELILKALHHTPGLNNCIPELISEKNLPMLQLADVGLWIVQAYHKLTPSRTDDHAKNIRSLYTKFQPVLQELKIGF